jgi:hypothetical protein
VRSQLEAAHTERSRLQELVEAPTEQGWSDVQARLEATLLQLSQLQVCASVVHDDDDADDECLRRLLEHTADEDAVAVVAGIERVCFSWTVIDSIGHLHAVQDEYSAVAAREAEAVRQAEELRGFMELLQVNCPLPLRAYLSVYVLLTNLPTCYPAPPF